LIDIVIPVLPNLRGLVSDKSVILNILIIFLADSGLRTVFPDSDFLRAVNSAG